MGSNHAAVMVITLHFIRECGSLSPHLISDLVSKVYKSLLI